MSELIQTSGLKDRRDFERLLAERFPKIAAEIHESESGVPHLEMAVFARATCKAVDLGDLQEAQSHIDFVDELLSDAGPELVNAVYVSYLEHVFLASQGARYVSARTMLSLRLRNALAELEKHWQNIRMGKTGHDR